MLRGGDVFKVTSVDEETGAPVIFNCKVLYWWEEQGIKHDCVIRDPRTRFSYLDRAAMMRETVNAFLLSVESDGEITERDEIPEGRWSAVLVSPVIRPLYLSYVRATGSAYDQIRAFHGKVKAHFDKSRRAGEYVPAPEIVEFNTIRSIGTFTLADLRSLSYAEFMKYEIISRELSGKRGKASGGIRAGGIPTELMANPNLSAAQIKNALED